MALNELNNKKIGFYTTITANNVDATHLPIAMRNSGGIIISYNANQAEIRRDGTSYVTPETWVETPHMWLSGTHIASGYGQDSLYRRNQLSYVSDSYGAVWAYIQQINDTLPIWVNSNSEVYTPIVNEFGYNDYIRNSESIRTVILKDNGNIATNQGSIAIGSYTQSFNEHEVAIGKYNYSSIPTNDNDKNAYTTFSIGVGTDYNRQNAIEVLTNGDVYLKGLGTYNNDLDYRYNGANALDPNVLSAQEYIKQAYSYSLWFSENYTNDKIYDLVGGAPDVLDTLKEISDYISDNGEMYTEVQDYRQIDKSVKYYVWVWNYNDDSKIYVNEIDLLLRYAYRALRTAKSQPNTTVGDISVNEILQYISNNASDTVAYLLSKQPTITNITDTNVVDVICEFFVKNNIDLTGTVYKSSSPYKKGTRVYNYYNYITRFIEITNNDYLDTSGNTKYYYISNSAKLISNLHNIESTYVTNKGYKANISYNWVSSIGETAYLDNILYSLLEKPQYKKPELTVTTQYNSAYVEVGTQFTPNITFGFNNTCYNPDILSYSNETLGMSYTAIVDNIIYGGEIFYESEDRQYSTTRAINTLAKHKCSKPEDYIMLKNVKYSYLHASYMYYPQLLLDNTHVVSLGKGDTAWFNNGMSTPEDIIIKVRYKYYFGWDATPNEYWAPNNQVYEQTARWFEIDDTATSPDIDFSEDHKSFWIAIPEHISLSLTEGKQIYYYTNLSEQDLVSNSCYITETLTGVISPSDKRYKILNINFNNGDGIQGHVGDYIKFTLSK